MIFPTKHVRPERSLLVCGAVILDALAQPRTVSSTWELVKQRPEVGTFDRFVLGADLLFTLGAICFDRGRLVRNS